MDDKKKMIANVAMSENEIVNENIEDDDGTQNKVEFDPFYILFVLEMLLSFHAWYKCGGPYICGNSLEVLKIQKTISEMLEMVKDKIPQDICNGWELQKFHDLLHVSRVMFMFGCPQNWDASLGEHNLIDFANQPAWRTQKWQSAFMMQMTEWLQENTAMGKAAAYFQMIEREATIDADAWDNANDVLGKPYGLIVMENGNHKFVHHGKSHAIAEIHPSLVNWILEQLCKNDSSLNGSACIHP